MRKKATRPMRARPKRGPTTAPAIQALDDFFSLGSALEEEPVEVGFGAVPVRTGSVSRRKSVAVSVRTVAGITVQFRVGGGRGCHRCIYASVIRPANIFVAAVDIGLGVRVESILKDQDRVADRVDGIAVVLGASNGYCCCVERVDLRTTDTGSGSRA
jgi:hypothetical protein